VFPHGRNGAVPLVPVGLLLIVVCHTCRSHIHNDFSLNWRVGLLASYKPMCCRHGTIFLPEAGLPRTAMAATARPAHPRATQASEAISTAHSAWCRAAHPGLQFVCRFNREAALPSGGAPGWGFDASPYSKLSGPFILL
jgi:hypothetical protein